jgi:2-polyprenyl-3-methyl-5-hydroxy-6-metoxy-1,4-benzoquinol methylase
MADALVKLMGWPATILHGDPAVFDRWRWLKQHLRGGPLRTLDAGCGSGAYTLYAAKRGNDALGLSWDDAQNEKARRRAALLGLRNAAFRPVDLRELDRHARSLGTFDQIICFETIEHIRDDAKLVRDLAALLEPGGRLLLTTPYKHYHPLLGDEVSDVEDGRHVRWGYTHDEMRDLFRAAGLEVVVADYVSGYVTQKLMNFERRVTRAIGRAGWAATFPLRPLAIFDAPLTRALRYPHLSIAVVGVKRG